MNATLLDAYRRTAFIAKTPDGELSLRVGQRSAPLDVLLTTHGVSTWAYVTAFNPGSVPLTAKENAARQRRFERAVAELGFVTYPGEGIADDGRWPPEPSLLILGVTRDAAKRLGREFGQLAVVYADAGHEAELLGCEWDRGALEELIVVGDLDLPAEGLAALASPAARPGVPFDRVAGMLLGLAIGDALGNTTESQLPRARRDEHGVIREYLPNRHAGGTAIGLPSDDTQLAFWMLESLLRHGRAIPDELAVIFSGRRIFGISRTVASFIREYQQGKPWYTAAPRSAGNGALMRIAPVVVPHLGRPSAALWTDAILAGAVTHNDRSSIAACVAFVGLLWDLLTMVRPPDPTWWIDTYCADRPGRERHPGQRHDRGHRRRRRGRAPRTGGVAATMDRRARRPHRGRRRRPRLRSHRASSRTLPAGRRVTAEVQRV